MKCEAQEIIRINENLEAESIGFMLENDCERCKRIREELEREEEWLEQRNNMIQNRLRKEEAERLALFEKDFFSGQMLAHPTEKEARA